MNNRQPPAQSPVVGQNPQPRVADATHKPLATVMFIAIAIIAGLLLTLLWDYKFVDKVIGEGLAHVFLEGIDPGAAGWLGTTAVAAVTGLAGTFTACNVACFASLGPLTAAGREEHLTGQSARNEMPSRWVLVKRAAGQLGIMAVGQMIVAVIYGAIVVLSARSLPMLADPVGSGMPPSLWQASLINVLLGISLMIVAYRYLSGRSLKYGWRGLLTFGAMLGLLLVGRPFPMFRDVLENAAASGSVIQSGLLMMLVVIGNMMLLSIVFLTLMFVAGPALQRLSSRRPRLILAISGALLLAMGVFSLAYWGFRVPAMFGVGWFPSV